MKLALSVRIAEAACKSRLNVPFRELVDLAAELGYEAVCMRASAGGVQTPRAELERMRTTVAAAGLRVSMVTADLEVPLNTERGPDSLRNIGPTLNVAEALGCDLVRVCLKTPEDIEHARGAADAAAARGIRLAHQYHTTTLFEQIEPSIAVLREIDRSNFGVIYEPANVMLCGEPYGEAALRRMAPWIMNVYVQNLIVDPAGPAEMETWCLGPRRFRMIPLWESGGVDFGEVFAGLDAIGYEGYVTVHQAYAELMGPREAAVESARYLRSV